MNKKVWFWTNKLDLCSGTIFEWIYTHNNVYITTPLAKIRSYDRYYFDIFLPKERLYESKEACKLALRDYKLNSILN